MMSTTVFETCRGRK